MTLSGSKVAPPTVVVERDKSERIACRFWHRLRSLTFHVALSNSI
ncbi:hypothetical protein COO91_10680 (plasmid) [Nostoc flagelliforme CCNUN1]|uniref:Uncharacterized protein n=1 Tax=Nostoc flagelliforme CCNUN1 TaxID=2038116 RepID=A0A2K8T9S2_9NOSO|nr:hypothetical protein COO91_10680 [Nostoc flagelliforme CCNUN1]